MATHSAGMTVHNITMWVWYSSVLIEEVCTVMAAIILAYYVGFYSIEYKTDFTTLYDDFHNLSSLIL